MHFVIMHVYIYLIYLFCGTINTQLQTWVEMSHSCTVTEPGPLNVEGKGSGFYVNLPMICLFMGMSSVVFHEVTSDIYCIFVHDQ